MADFDVLDASASIDVVAVCLSAFVLVLSGAFSKTWTRIRRTPAIWLVVYYLFCAISSIWSTKPIFTLYRSLEYLTLFFATIASVDQYNDFEGAERVFFRLTTAVIVLEIAVIIRLIGFSLSLGSWHSNSFTTASAILFCYCLGEYLSMSSKQRLNNQERARRLLKFGVFSFFTLILGTSSGSNIAASIGCLLIFIILRRFWLLLLGFWGVLLIFIFGGGWDIIQPILFPGKSETNIETGTGRAFLWEFLWTKYLQSPVLGYGFGLVGVVSGGMALHAHNSIFTVIIGTGLIGFIIFGLFSLSLWRETIITVWRRGEGTVGYIAALAVAFINSLSMPILADRWKTYSVIFVWLLGLFFIHIRDNRITDNNEGI